MAGNRRFTLRHRASPKGFIWTVVELNQRFKNARPDERVVAGPYISQAAAKVAKAAVEKAAGLIDASGVKAVRR